MSLLSKSRLVVRFLVIPFLTAHFGSLVARANIIYSVNTTITSANPTGNPLQKDTVQGTITTDGTIGAIAAGNVLSWNLNLIDTLNAANDYNLTTANSSLVEDTGGALSATATALLFDFSGSGEFLIQANSPGPFSGFRYFCFSTGVFACATGETISPNSIFLDGVILTGASAPVGQQPLNPPGSVPEPSTCGLMLASLLGLRAGLKRRFPKPAA